MKYIYNIRLIENGKIFEKNQQIRTFKEAVKEKFLRFNIASQTILKNVRSEVRGCEIDWAQHEWKEAEMIFVRLSLKEICFINSS